MPGRPFSAVLSNSSDALRESAKARMRALQSISASAEIIGRSRELLSSWPLSGTPRLGPGMGTWDSNYALPEQTGAALPVSSADPRSGASVSAEAALERVEEQSFEGTTVRLDGRHFVDCTVENCILEYSGGPVILEGTNFSGCGFSFVEEAGMTVAMLRCFGLYDGQQETATPSTPQGSTRVN